MKKTLARFASKCAETGRPIKKGEEMIYDPSTKSCYSFYSKVWNNFGLTKEDQSTRDMVQANEDDFYDNWCNTHNI